MEKFIISTDSLKLAAKDRIRTTRPSVLFVTLGYVAILIVISMLAQELCGNATEGACL